MSPETVTRAGENLLRAAIAVLGAERATYIDAAAMTRLKAAEDDLKLAARDLTNAVDDVPPSHRPEGWALDGDDDG